MTAAHDQQTARAPRYWIDLDDETFEAQLKEMSGRIHLIDTMRRPNLMTQHVEYVD